MKVFEVWAFHGSAVFYLLTAFWSVAYFIWDRRFRLRWGQTFLSIGFVLETLALIARGLRTGQPPIFSGFEFLVSVVWALVACCLVMSILFKVRLIIPFAVPVIAILFTLSVINFSTHGADKQTEQMELVHRLWVGFHVGALIMSMGCFILSFATSLMYILQERRLKSSTGATGWARRLPALEKLDRLSFGSIGYGHLLLTLGLLIPVVLAGEEGLEPGPGSLVIWGLIVWVIYGSLLITRAKMLFGQRRIALLTVTGAVLGTLAYPFIRFLLDAGPRIHKALG